jgi:hypothetical protein
MSERHFTSAPITMKMPVGTDNCPRVADLIDYALGQANADDRQRVEAHLQTEECNICRSWVEKAARLRAEPWPNGTLTPTPVALSAPAASAPINSPTPIPPSSKFQRQVLTDLEERLRALEENV